MTRLLLLPAAAGVALLATACGGSPPSRTGQTAGAAAFSRCVRAHGVPRFPDPAAGGLLPKQTPQQLGVARATFDRAQGACIHLVPNGGEPTPVQVARVRSAMLGYARCIRGHGVPNMPDPDPRGHLDIGPGTHVDVNSPAFQAAYGACRSRLTP
jgi:hypothetical protein